MRTPRRTLIPGVRLRVLLGRRRRGHVSCSAPDDGSGRASPGGDQAKEPERSPSRICVNEHFPCGKEKEALAPDGSVMAAGSSRNGTDDATRVKPHERQQRILDRILEQDSLASTNWSRSSGSRRGRCGVTSTRWRRTGRSPGARRRHPSPRADLGPPGPRRPAAECPGQGADSADGRAVARDGGHGLLLLGLTVARVAETLTEEQHDQLTMVTHSVRSSTRSRRGMTRNWSPWSVFTCPRTWSVPRRSSRCGLSART